MATKEFNSYTYLMSAPPLLKIGKSDNPDARRKTLSTGNPAIELVGYCGHASESMAFAHESELHTHFDEWHHHGEWFEDPDGRIASDVLSMKGWGASSTARPVPGTAIDASYPLHQRHVEAAIYSLGNPSTLDYTDDMKRVVLDKAREKATEARPVQFIKWQAGKFHNRSNCSTVLQGLKFAHRSNEEFGEGNPAGATFLVDATRDELWVVRVDGETSLHPMPW